MTFSATITTLRYQLRLTQAELARLLDVDKQSVSNWECGRNQPWPARQAEILETMRKVAPDKRECGLKPPCTRRPSISERILR